jgi:hypothetical protein
MRGQQQHIKTQKTLILQQMQHIMWREQLSLIPHAIWLAVTRCSTAAPMKF